MRELLQAGAHFGHQTRFWNPKMAEYIFSTRHKIHIINLEKTIPLYQDAVNFLGSLAGKRGKILFVGTKPAAKSIIREEAERCGMPYISNRWLGGLLTNYKTVRQSIRYMKELEEKRDSKEFADLTKKEALNVMRELSKLETNLRGIKNMGGLPDAIFVIDVGHEKIAINEARKLKIPVIGIVDTNRDPTTVDYVIPANDDASSAIRLYVKGIADAILEAKSTLPPEEIVPKEVKKGGRKQPFPNKEKKRVVTRGSHNEHPQDVEHKTSKAKEEPELKLESTEQAEKSGEVSEKKSSKPKREVAKPKIITKHAKKAVAEVNDE